MAAHLPPNWFAGVMGTGIVATAGATLPLHVTGLRGFGTAAWALATIALVALVVMSVRHWQHNTTAAREHHHDPVLAHFYGAPPMAILTVGAATLLVGRDLVGVRLAVDIDWALWFTGTIAGLVTTVAVPHLMFVRHRLPASAAFGGWLMPVVPPMVSASTGALLIPYAPDGAARVTLLISCYALFALSLLASVPVLALIVHRLRTHGAGEARMVPTLWIVLGPLGQSITAVNLLAGAATTTVATPTAHALRTFAVGYGIPVWTAAAAWAALALASTVRAARAGLPFSLTWWSFTFPVGTFVTGSAGLARHTGDAIFTWVAVGAYVVLVAAWLTVSARTIHGATRGGLLRAPATATRADRDAAAGPAPRTPAGTPRRRHAVSMTAAERPSAG